MKYENRKRANEICNEIEGKEKILHELGAANLVVSMESPNGWPVHKTEIFAEKDETLQYLAHQYKKSIAQYYRNRIESLKSELEKL